MTYMHSHTAMTSAKPSQSRCPWVPGVRNGPRHTQDHSGILRGPLIHWMYTVGLLNHCMITPGHWVNSKSLHSTMTKLCFYLCKVLLSDTDRHTLALYFSFFPALLLYPPAAPYVDCGH